MPQESQSDKKQSVKKFAKDLRRLEKSFEDNLRMPSLDENPPRVEGFGYKYTLLLPILSATGATVFGNDHLTELLLMLSRQFGGCQATSASAHSPIYGFYQPEGREPEKDYHVQILILANPIDSTDEFFTELKKILRNAPLIPQEEIVIEQADVKMI